MQGEVRNSGGPSASPSSRQGCSYHGAAWLACYAAFVAAYHFAASAPARARTRMWSAIVVQEMAILAMGLIAPCQFAALALVVVALQVALHLAPARVATALVAQTAIVSAIVMRGCGAEEAASWLLAMCGFQAAAAVAVLLARREHDARAELWRTHAELRAARELRGRA